ncbi:MAG: sensor histidine kinase [Candidatus Methylomirabilia bacterium]
MTLRVAIVRDEPLETAALVEMLQAGGAETLLLTEPPPDPDPTVHLVLLDQALLSGAGPSLIQRVHERHPAALVCRLAAFAHRPLQADSLPAGLWDSLYLPAQPDEVSDLLSRTEAFVARRARSERPREILVVDDEESIREACGALLVGRGFRAEMAVDALEAIGKLHQQHFDLVVTDLQMPGIDGMALLARIRAAYPQLPVVISTGHATVETAIAALRTGAVDFIRKPFGAADFVQVIERALRYGELSRSNLELEAQAREEKIRLRDRQYELRVLADAIAEMSRAVQPAQVADCWLRAAGQVLDFVCGAFFLAQPDPELVLFERRAEGCRPAELLALLAQRAPGLTAGVSLEGLRVRHIAGAQGAERPESPNGVAAQVHVLGPAAHPCAGVVLLQASGEGPSALQESFLHSITEPAAQVLEKLRALAGESQLRETAMMAGMHQGVILTDLEGRILVLNAAARELLGLEPTQRARSLALLSAERQIPLDAAIAELLRGGGETLCREFPLRQPEERILTLDLTLIRGGSGEPNAVVGLLRDITEMRESERMKSEFVAIVSHELRTPLTTIKNCNSLLLSGSTGPISEPQERFLRMAQVSIDRIARLVNDLLDMAKIESGRLHLECTAVDLSLLLREVGNETEHLLLEQELRLAYGGLETPLVICADRDRLKQVFLNLVHNAVKFSPPGGLIEVRAREVAAADVPPAILALLQSPDAPLVEVQVIDEGVGIAQEDLGRIFDRFQQVEQTLRREHGGIGLGLPISRGIIRSHGGEIWAESRESGGSAFRVLLPRERAAGDGDNDGGAGEDETGDDAALC